MESRKHEDGAPAADRREALPSLREDERRVPRAAAAGKPMMLWVVYPGNPQEPPFHLSNTPGVMLIAASDADYARRLAANEAGDTTWLDKARVHVDEYRPGAAMVLSRDFRG